MSRQTDLLREIAAAMSSGLIGTIAYHDTRTVDQRHDILNDQPSVPKCSARCSAILTDTAAR